MMFGIMATLNAQLKLPPMFKNLNREERYQIQSLVRVQHKTTEIARLLVWHPSCIGSEIKRGRGLKGYLAEQATAKLQNESASAAMQPLAPGLWLRI